LRDAKTPPAAIAGGVCIRVSHSRVLKVKVKVKVKMKDFFDQSLSSIVMMVEAPPSRALDG
jgi:hypothetical protein